MQHEIGDIYLPFYWVSSRIKCNDGALGEVAQDLITLGLHQFNLVL